MTEELIAFPTAVSARELGFNWKVSNYFDEEGHENGKSHETLCDFNTELIEGWVQYSRPSQSLLARWLRDQHQIHVETYWGRVHYDHPDHDVWSVLVHHLDKFCFNDGKRHPSYEKAFEHGLQKALEHLLDEKKSNQN